MIGKYSAKLDEKSRLFVPAKLRSELGDTFFVTLGVNCGHRCLTIYTSEEWKRLSDHFNALSISQRAGATSLIFMNAAECTPDKQFRFSLTQFLLDYAGIDREVFTLCKNEKYGQLIENLENVEDSASQMADFALSGQTVAQQITMLAGLTAEDADAALQHILSTDRMAVMDILPDGTAPLAENEEEAE